MKIGILNQPRTAGLNSRKPRVSLTKFLEKGYPAIWTIGSDPNGLNLKEGEGAAHRPEKEAARWRAIGGGDEDHRRE
jgi:hypothetical protein